MTRERAPSALVAAIAIAAVAWDPRAPAADVKRTLGLLVAVVAIAAVIARPPKEHRAPPRAVLAWLGFVAWSGASLAWGAPLGARDLASWIAAAGLAIVASGLGASEARALVERAAILAGAGAAAIGIAQRLAGARGVFVHGGQGNANWLGLLLAVTLPLTAWIIVDPSRPKAARTACLASSALQLAGLALSHSRVAWAASAVASLPIVLAVARRAASRRARAATIAAPAILGVAAIALALRASPIAAPPASIAEGADVPVAIAWGGRTWIWRSSIDAAVSALPAGAGLGRFAPVYLDAQGKRLAPLPPKVASRRFLNATTAHSDWIQVLVEGGLPALTLLALAIAWALRASLRAPWPSGAAVLLAFSVCAAGDSPLRQPAIALLLALVLAAAPDPAPRSLPAWLVPSSRIATLAAGALLLAASTGGYLAARRLTAAREAAPPERRALLAAAARLDPRSGEIALERGLLALELGDPEAALPELRRARDRLANVGTDIAIGNALVLLGRDAEALAAYQAALARHPGSFRAHANITQPLVTLGKIDEAASHLAIARSLFPGHPRLADMAQRIVRARADRDTALDVQ